jgi:hypothetical protein
MVVVVFAFVRLYKVTQAASEGAVDGTELADTPLILSLWTQIEAAVAVIVANLPALRSFIRRQLGGPEYSSKESSRSRGSSSATSKKTYQVHHTSKMEPVIKSKSVMRQQSVELASLDEEWPIRGKAAAMLGITDRTVAMKILEAGNADILTTTEYKVTRSPRPDQHRRVDSGGNTFGLQLRPDIN